jgi:hypothetical protein
MAYITIQSLTLSSMCYFWIYIYLKTKCLFFFLLPKIFEISWISYLPILSVSHELCIMRIKLDEVRVTLSFVLYVVFCRSLFVLLSFFYFVNCVVFSSPIYGFWLPLWYLQTFFFFYISRFLLTSLMSLY